MRLRHVSSTSAWVDFARDMTQVFWLEDQGVHPGHQSGSDTRLPCSPTSVVHHTEWLWTTLCCFPGEGSAGGGLLG